MKKVVISQICLQKITTIVVVLLVCCQESPEKKRLRENQIAEYIALGNSYFTNKDYKLSYINFKQAVKLGKKQGEIYFKLAYSADKGESKPDEALKYYDIAIEHLSGMSNLWYLSGSYFNSGVIYKNLKNTKKEEEYFASAFDLLNKIFDMNIRDGITIFRLAYCYKERNNPAKAIELYQNAAEILKTTNPEHPYYAGSYFNIGIIYLEQKKFDDTIKMWKTAISIEPQNQYFKSWLSKVQEMRQEKL